MRQRRWYLLVLGCVPLSVLLGLLTGRLLVLGLLGVMMAGIAALAFVTSDRDDARLSYGLGVGVVTSLAGLAVLSLGPLAVGVFLVLMVLPSIAYAMYGPESVVLWGSYAGVGFSTGALALYRSSPIVAAVFLVAGAAGARKLYATYGDARPGSA